MDAGSLDDLQRLLGTFDENLNIITAELGVTASVEGAAVKVCGDAESAAVALCRSLSISSLMEESFSI